MKKKPWLSICVFCVVALGIGVLPAEIQAAPAFEISITDDGFAPQVAHIPVDTTVTWTNLEGFHTTTSKAGLWDSGVLSPGDTFTYHFDTAGIYYYYDTVYSWPSGTIEVVHSLANIAIETDKALYVSGEVVNVGLSLENPGDAIQLGVYIWFIDPNGKRTWIMNDPSVSLPAAYTYSNGAWLTKTLPPLSRGEYSLHAALLKNPEQDLVSMDSCSFAFGEAVQSDWSAGPGTPAPSPIWEGGFNTSSGVGWRSIAGQLSLTAEPRSSFVESVIAYDADRPNCVAVGDLNGDGTVDVISTDPVYNILHSRGAIYWWEYPSAGSWVVHVVDNEFYGAHHVDTADVDSDGDLDVIGAAYYGDDPGLGRNGKYAWFENLKGDGSSWKKHVVGDYFWGADYIHAGDIDGDGDIDLAGASDLTDGILAQEADIAWFENIDGNGVIWAQHDIDLYFDNASEVHVADLDGDGDADLVCANSNPYGPSQFTWWENLNGDASEWTKHLIPYEFWGAGYLDVGDVDNDGDLDLLGGGRGTSSVGWWENLDGAGTNWISWTVTTMPGGRGADLLDIDGDGDLDGLLWNTYWVMWCENLDGVGFNWNPLILTYLLDNPWAAAGDVNNDGKLEVVACSEELSSYPGTQLRLFEMNQYTGSGELVGSVLDGGQSPDWGIMTWDAAVPSGTSLLVEVRASNDEMNLGAFVTVPNSGFDLKNLIDPNARYLQYQVSFTSSDPELSPVLRDVNVAKGLGL